MRPPESFVRRTVRPLAAYGPPRDPAAVPLHLNESPTDLPQDLKAELCDRILQSDWSKYPISDGARLAADLAAAYGLDPAGVLVGNGSNELLQLLLFACIEPGDEVVVAAPSFALYSLQAAALGARVVEVRLRARDGAFRFPVDELLRSAQNAKLVLLGSPNNPTGTTLTAADAVRLAREAPGLVGIDEAYRDFCDQDFVPLLAQAPRRVGQGRARPAAPGVADGARQFPDGHCFVRYRRWERRNGSLGCGWQGRECGQAAHARHTGRRARAVDEDFGAHAQ